MSFIIKKFLRKMIEQYLNIYDQISLQKGQLQLPSGHLNQININKILKAKGVPAMIVYSQYTNLGLSLPIIQILSKPIVLKMESLRVVILVESEILNNIDNNKQQKIVETVQSKNQQRTEKVEDKSQSIKQQKDKSTKSQKSYLKSIVNRLLTNMELQIKRLQIIIRYANRPASGQEAFHEIDEHEYKITLENLVAKNSLSLLQANILKKIICMSKFSITVHKISKQEQMSENIMEQKNQKQESKQNITKIAEILDLNMSLNIDYTRLTMICLLDKLRIGLETKLVSWILHKLEQTKRQTQTKTKGKSKTKEGHRKKEKKKQQQNIIKPNLQGVQIKVNQIVFSLFNSDNGHNLQERKNVELFNFCILGLEVQKEKTKGYKERVAQNGQLEESPQINQSQITINLQSISMLCRNKVKSKRNKYNNEMLQFVGIKMCEKNKKLVNSTIESWNKNKRKQFTIILNLRRKQINSITIDDLHVFFLVDSSVLGNIRHLTQWFNSKIKRLLPLLMKKKKMKGISPINEQKQQKTKMETSKIPEICLKNIKISSSLELQEQKLSISVSLPEVTKIITWKQYKNKNIIENAQILINKIQIHINQKNESITITQVKLCEKVQRIQQNAYKQVNRQHIISIHSIFCSFDTCTLRQIGTFFTFSHFYEFAQLIQKIKDNIQNINLIYASQVQKKLAQLPSIKQEQHMRGQQEQIQQKQPKPQVQQIQQVIKSEYNIYLRVNSLIISLGAYIKQYRDPHQKKQQMACRHRYNPILMVQSQTIKALICLKQKNQSKANIKMSLKSISCISPHNLSHGSILKYPVRVKLFHSTNYSNNDKNMMKKEEKGTFGQDANLNGCNYGVEILDPIHIDLQQQYIYLLANLCKNIIPQHNPRKAIQSQKSQTFTTIKNLIKQQITLQYNNITSTSTISSNKSMTQNKNEEIIQFQNTNNVVFKQYCVNPGCEEEIYLFDMCVSILINGELSQPIFLTLPNIQNKQDQIQPNTQMEMQKSGVESSAKQKIGKNGQQPQVQEQKKQRQKSLNETKGNPNRNVDRDSKLKMQKAIIFPYHDECRYILQVDYENGHLKLNIKYKYELHIFEGVEQYCGLKMLQIRCIKFNKYEKFESQQHSKSMEDLPLIQVDHAENKDHVNKNIMAMDWELLEQENLQHLSFLIQTSKIQEYKVHRLMTNSIKYKIYGLYPINIIQKKQIDANKTFNQIYHYYILEEVAQNYTNDNTQRTDLNTHHYYLMPFLILINNLSNHDIKLNITNKKSSLAQEFSLKALRHCMPCDNNFDYYMKQYMIRLQIEENAGRNQDVSIYESEEHYFNTFFMVDQSFQNVIELRCTSSKANLNYNKRHIRMRESFIKKTKILQIQDCLNLQNKTDYNIHIQILAQTMGKTFKNIGNVSQANKCSMELNCHSQKNYPIKLKKNDNILISYVANGNKQNSIQVPVSKLNQNNNKLLLSYNFCKKEHKNIHKHHHQKETNNQQNQQNKEQQKYYQILIKLELKTFSHNTQNLSYNSSNLQSQLVFSPFLTFTNLCSRNRKLKMNNRILQSCYHNMKSNKKQDYSVSLSLPSNTNKDYNNKYLVINTEQIYQDLLVNSRNWIMQGNNHYLKIQLLPQPHSKSTDKHLKREQKSQSTHSIYLNELITHKTLQFNKSVYSLIKNLKDDIIELYFSDHLFNTNVPAKYFVFNNSTEHYFLMNSSQTQYAKYLLFPNRFQDDEQNKNKKIQFKEQKQNQKGAFKKQMKVLQQQAKLQSQANNSKLKSQKDQTAHQKQIKTTQIFDDFLGSKVHIEGKSKNPVSMMLNKDKHDIFLCDSQYHKLESLTVRKLQKLKIKQEKYQIQNFTILDFQSQNYNKKSEALQTSPQYQFSTSTITLKLFSKRKNCGIINQIKSISMRHFENDKTDILIQDISVSVALQMQQIQPKSNQNTNQSTVTQNIGQSTMSQKSKLQFFQILRIPEQSYVLVEGKSYLDKLVLVKNIYIKCKIIDLHVNRQLLIVLSYFGKVGKFLAELSKSTPAQTNQNRNLEYKQAKKIQKLVKQKILLIKSVYIHPINLCLAVQTNPSMDFSNMITLPEYTISNKVYRISNISKQISNHYLANVIAKFPKLSFIYQNLRNPISMVKSILETRNILISNQKEEERKKIAWAMSYVDLQKKYFGFNYIKFPQKRLIQFLGFNNRKYDPQLDRVNQILLQITLDYPQNVHNRQIFICVLKNVVSSNITRLSQMVNIPLSYYLTNKNVRVISPNLPGESVSLKQIQSAKVVRYNKKNAELVITFKRRGAFIKIVDQFIVCHNLISSLNSVLM